MIQRSSFPIALVFPPQAHFTQPYLALPCIKAWLQAHGYGDVRLYDASVEAYDRFLSRERLEWAQERVAERLPLSAFAGRAALPFSELEGFRASAESAARAEVLVEEVERAKQIVRGPEFSDLEQYLPAVRTLYHGLRLYSAAHFPAQLTPHNFTMRYANDRSAEVRAATLDELENPFIAFYGESLLPRLIERRPRLVGLSIIYGSQLVPALTLARMLKQALPECHITAGGGFLAYIGRKLLRARSPDGKPAFADCLDSIVFHEGEQPMLELAQALESSSPLHGIGSLWWYDHTRPDSPLVENAQGHPIALDQAPVPDFDGLPLERYFSPELVIPYDINRGCYYGECTFCTLPTVIGPGYRTRSAATIVDHVMALSRQLRTKNVNFITDCMPPGMIKDLPEELLRRDARLHWWADARVEPKAYTPEGARRLYESGCRKLLFGFETATPRLLKLMQKGQSVRATLEVAENCSRAGISVTFYAMVGFPSETREEARATLRFLLDHSDVVREVSLQTFHIDEVAHTYREPAAFGIKILDDPAADLQLYHDYESDSGMTQDESAEMFEEMLAGLRARLPLFAGDHIYFFMQKSHYFLHLAAGATPDGFAQALRERSARRERIPDAAALCAPAGLRLLPLPYSYKEALAKLGSPLARAIRPDFLTGRFVAGAHERAEQALGALSPSPRVLAWAPDAGEPVELAPDGARVLEALARAGSLAALCEQVTDQPGARDKLAVFGAKLWRLGLLTERAGADARLPALSPSNT